MNAYIYQAALLCEACGEKILADWHALQAALNTFSTPQRVQLYDSDMRPIGPYPDGGGEADSPQHCDSCHAFLENPLTLDGIEYVRDTLERDDKHANREVLNMWHEFYRDSLESFP